MSADAIYAPATPPGAAARAVMRISGPGVLARMQELLPSGWPLPTGPGAFAGKWRWQANLELEVATLCFAAPGSSTGEDVIELHFPGSVPLREQIEEHLQTAGLRMAEAGEFTRRAFLNGRLDLAQAEAVLDLIHARNAEQAMAAAAVVGGSLGGELQAARNALVHALVQLEAGLDFEEGDSQDLTPAEIHQALATARAAMQRGESGEQRRRTEQAEHWSIALVGAPNAGKTSLFAALTERKALISNIAGTTRDRLQASWPRPQAWQGQVRPWLLCDLPGLGGEASDARDDVARRRVQADRFDLQILCIDGSDPCSVLPDALPDTPQIIAVTKCDLPNRLSAEVLRSVEQASNSTWLSTQAETGLGNLADAVGTACRLAEQHHATSLRSVERHCQALVGAREQVERAEHWIAGGGHHDLAAEEIRSALMGLAELVGEFTPEDLLDQLFGEFCVGK